MAISYVGSGTLNNTASGFEPLTGQPITLAMPAGVIQGDLLIARLCGQPSSTNFIQYISAVLPKGWFPVAEKSGLGLNGPFNGADYFFFKIATSSEPASYTFYPQYGTLYTCPDFTYDINGIISAWRGVHSQNGFVGMWDINGAFPLTDAAITLPVTTGKALLFAYSQNKSTITDPAGTTVRYNQVGVASHIQSMSCADIDVSGGTTPSFQWTFGAAGTGDCRVLVVTNEDVGITWTELGNPDLQGHVVTDYTARVGDLHLGPGNSDHLYTMRGTTIFPYSSFKIEKYSRSSGALITQSANLNSSGLFYADPTSPAVVSEDDASYYWGTYFDSSPGSPTGSDGRVFRYDTATLSQQAVSPWISDDGVSNLALGRGGTPSAGLLAMTTVWSGSTLPILNIYNATTLALLKTVAYADLFNPVLHKGFIYDICFDCRGELWALILDDDSQRRMVHFDSNYTPTRYNYTGSGSSIGLHPRLDALVITGGSTTLWSLSTHAVIATYTPTAWPQTDLGSQPPSYGQLKAQTVGITNAGLWHTRLLIDRTTTFEDDFYHNVTGYFVKINGDTLTLEATYPVPSTLGFAYIDTMTLDVTQTPYRLWAWAQYPMKIGYGPGLDQTSGPGSYGGWATYPFDDSVDGYNPFGNGSVPVTIAQQIHARGWDFYRLLYATVPTIAGIGSVSCNQGPTVIIIPKGTSCDPITLHLNVTDQRTVSLASQIADTSERCAPTVIHLPITDQRTVSLASQIADTSERCAPTVIHLPITDQRTVSPFQ